MKDENGNYIRCRDCGLIIFEKSELDKDGLCEECAANLIDITSDEFIENGPLDKGNSIEIKE